MLATPPPPPIVAVDRAGDGGTAPDITKVKVATSAKGRIAFVVVLATPYGKNSSLYVYFGTQYRLGPGGLEVWDPPANEYEPLGSESGTFSVAPGGRAVGLSTELSELGNPTALAVVVQSLDGAGGTGQVDTARLRWTRGQKGRSP